MLFKSPEICGEDRGNRRKGRESVAVRRRDVKWNGFNGRAFLREFSKKAKVFSDDASIVTK